MSLDRREHRILRQVLNITLARLRRPAVLTAIVASSVLVFGCRGDAKAPEPTPTATAAPSTATAPSPTAISTIATPDVLEWETCSRGFECTTIVVPLDYGDPALGTISLPLIRRPAADEENRIGSLLVNPGGPGVSGVDFVRGASTIFSADVRERFDIVGWDPRGVAGSDPAVDCTDDLDAFVSGDPSPDSVQEQEQLNAYARTLAEACAARSGALLPHLATENTARDMDRIRAALGDDKLTYFGYSYGTFLGAIYADLFPLNIRALVLDAAVDPSIGGAEDAKNQIVGFEHALDAFLADCQADSDCAYYSGGNPGAAFDALMAEIELAPLAGDGSLDVGPGLAFLGVAAALYDENTGWPTLAAALAAAEEGDGSALLSLSDFITGRLGPGSYNDELEQRIAIVCVDVERLTSEEKLTLQQQLAVEAPRLGKPGIGPAGDPCDFWPVPSQREPRAVTAPGAPPIVVIGTTGDPATPYQQAVSLAGQLSSGVLLTLVGEGHTAYGGRSDCIDDAVDAYLIDLVPPVDGLRCE
jgi:pimeloyl-ACP methyl ester carboxylesterase